VLTWAAGVPLLLPPHPAPPGTASSSPFPARVELCSMWHEACTVAAEACYHVNLAVAADIVTVATFLFPPSLCFDL